ncbi:M20 family metallopeptidase [Haloarchaeobius iranensis]|uniref:Succinyl-diaminopimelate desuccinylase n=1 Tax=Haloarchaeobius iranensis TaxID=996166 RepID=A0A1G9U927_9EURY|nr:M20 family metallopeptidase [Haloarchaeobius iranensis]SDM56506.1 succinyl-diaminopimelate desuccinylase [Haloarchaeobius iranensis]
MVEASDAEYPDDVVDLAARLVRVDSENPPGNERPCAEYVVDWFTEHGVDAELVPTPNTDRPNAVATVGSGDPTLVLNGHTDVVPADDPDEWAHDPFGGEVEDGRLWGRGSTDMKTGLALAMVATLNRERADAEPPGTLVVHAAAGEETGLPGTRTLIEEGYGGDYAVVLEPTELRVATSAKGVVTYRIGVHGESTHASNPDEGTNAIDGARDVMDRIDEYDARLRERSDPLVGQAYANVTAFEAGTGSNMAVVPARAEFLLDRRILPDESIEDVDREVDDLLAAAEREDGVVAERETVQHYASAGIEPNHPLAELVRDGTGDLAPDEPWGMAAATDAREFVADGTPAVVWGPGSLSEAHTVDESIPVAEAERALPILESVVEDVLSGGLDG